MLEYAIYSVISPEGCASILWKDAAKAGDAARAMGITADKILGHRLVDDMIKEPLGGAHRDLPDMSRRLSHWIVQELSKLKAMPIEMLLSKRYHKFMAMGV